MTDITDQDRRDAREWAEDVAETFKYDDEVPRETRAAVNYILATVDAPEPTLAEEVKKGLLFRVNDTDAEGIKDALDLAARVEQIEQERDWYFKEVENVRTWKETLINERDQARSEVKYLDSEIKRLTAERDAEVTGGAVYATPDGRMGQTQYGTFRPAADLPDPADVPAGEVWSAKIWYGDEQYPGTAIKTTGGDWNVYRAEGTHSTYRTDEYVELVARLVPETDLIDRAATNAAETITNAFGVPAPRQVTTREILDEAPRRTVIRDKDGVVCERASLGDGWYSPESTTDQTDYIKYPATVLWTPEVPA